MAIRFLEVQTVDGLKTINLFHVIKISPYVGNKTSFQLVNGTSVISHKPYEDTRKIIFKKEVSDAS
jgi:hypothetical protein